MILKSHYLEKSGIKSLSRNNAKRLYILAYPY